MSSADKPVLSSTLPRKQNRISSTAPPMWPQWLSSPSRRFSNTPPPSPPPSSRSLNFSCSSFKDIQSLLHEPPEPVPSSSSPKSPSLFRRIRISTSGLRAWDSRASLPPHPPHALPPGLDRGVVVYITSLRVVRHTFDDCRAVRFILRNLGVAVDERDVSIDDRFRDELHSILGRRSAAPLPRVFVGGEYVGGADDIRRLHESGELQRMIERMPRLNQSGCDRCGGFRFVVCEDCDGSHKVFAEKIGGFRSCSSCNANGLIRCPACFFVLPRHTK